MSDRTFSDSIATYVPLDRTLHVVDLDSLVSGLGQAHSAPTILDRYFRSSVYRTGDHVLVAGRTSFGATAIFELGVSARIIPCGRLDPVAALLDAVDPIFTASRYDHVVIVSGNRRFASLTRRLRSLGRPVTVVAQSGRLATALRMATPSIDLRTWEPAGA